VARIYEVRWQGRGGQGIVLANMVFAVAALKEGKYVQAFPEFGPERSGAPVRGFTRISVDPINLHQQVYAPDVLSVIDSAFMTQASTFEGLKPDGTLVANIEDAPNYSVEGLRKQFRLAKQKVVRIDAVKIANEVFGRSIYNTTMMGAVARATGFVKPESLVGVLRERALPQLERFTDKIIEQNAEAIRRGYEEAIL
jgi:pyruvate ferredoxin oxidoreductase gamma subunit